MTLALGSVNFWTLSAEKPSFRKTERIQRKASDDEHGADWTDRRDGPGPGKR